MLKIRLTRRGKKNNAFFRIVVAEHTSPIKGGFLEVLGFLNPHTKEKDFKADRIKYWLEKGAQCSDSVHNLLVTNGVVKGPKRAVKLKKKPVETASAEVKPGEEEKKLPEAADSKPESKDVEKSTDTKEEKKEEKGSENTKPEPKKKDVEDKAVEENQ